MTFLTVMDFHQIIVVMNDVKQHTYIHTANANIAVLELLESKIFFAPPTMVGGRV